MNHTLVKLLAAFVLIVGWPGVLFAGDRTQAGERTALDRYIAAPDTNYAFNLVSTIKGEGYTTYFVEMTSQAWLTTNEVDRPLWKHWLTIVRPDKVSSSTSLLFIGGGCRG